MDPEKKFPYEIEDDMGEILDEEELCPGVYYFTTRREGSPIAREFYAASAHTPCLSRQAKAFGEPLPHHPEFLAYAIEGSSNGYLAVRYEVLRYRMVHNLPLSPGEDLHEMSVFGMEQLPEYFGDYTVPNVTPMGFTLRYTALDRGVFLLETHRCERGIAVCYPVWSVELSDYVVKKGRQMDLDRLCGIHTTYGYLYFPERTGCLAIFELWKGHPAIRASGAVRPAALMNAVWEYDPAYAAAHNLRQQTGLNGGTVLETLGLEAQEPSPAEDLVYLSPEAGTEYLEF